jgi:N-acetylneuraminic acid mutarotase
MKTSTITKIILTCVLIIFSTIIYGQKEGDWNTLTPPNSPEARHGHSMVTLPDGRVMLFGGEGPQEDLFNDLFIYDNNDWKETTPDNDPPSPRRNHEAWMVGDFMYIYGGLGPNGPLNDMWTYHIVDNLWNEQNLTGSQPPARYGHTITPLNDGSVLILGGKDTEGNKLKEFWRMNPDHSCVRLSDSPRPYYKHISKLTESETGEKILLVFGASDLLGFYRVADRVWGEVAGGFPLSEMNSHIVNNDFIFVFGGKDENGTLTNNVYSFNTSTGQLTTRSYPIPAKIENGGGAKYFGDTKNPDDYRVLLFGGIVGGEVSNTTSMSSNNLLAIDEINADNKYNIVISPNPTNGPLMINANKKIEKILICDINERFVKELEMNQQKVSLNINSLNNGIYFIKIWIDQNQITRKIIKR